jgi:squalene synthase HpnC
MPTPPAPYSESLASKSPAVAPSVGSARDIETLRTARRFTRRLALSHYENFVVGGLLTPRAVRQHFYNVYAFCRMADDLADEIGDPEESLRALDQWSSWLVSCYRGDRVDHPVFVALRDTIEAFEIPPAPFLALIDAFRGDQHKNRFATFDEVVTYSVRSANPVGHIVLYLGRCFSADRATLSDQICTGLQLANFWQDVHRDALRNRIYVPGESLREFGVTESSLVDPTPPANGPEMIASLVQRTRGYFQRGLPLADDVPLWLGRNVRMFAGGGMATLEAIAGAGYDVWTRRPTVGRFVQVRLMAKHYLFRR